MSKALELLSILPHRPAEFYDRLAAIADVKSENFSRKPPRYDPISWESAIDAIGKAIEVDAWAILREPAIEEVERAVLQGIDAIPSSAPFKRLHNGDLRLGRICYLLSRAMQPEVAIETGTCYGVSSAFILKALQLNGRGMLNSIDLPPLGKSADDFVGYLIPSELRTRWKLHRGTSKRLMRRLLPQLGKVDFFLHDSLHTYRNIRRECETIRPYLSSRGVLIVDDIQDNAAFSEWVGISRPRFSAVIPEQHKEALFGISLFG